MSNQAWAALKQVKQPRLGFTVESRTTD